MPIRPENRQYYRTPAFRDLRARLKLRANNRCEHCHAPFGQRGLFGHRRLGVVLTVAHLDHDPRHQDDSKCMFLCARCHLRHDRASNYARRRRYRAAAAGQAWLLRDVEMAETPERAG